MRGGSVGERDEGDVVEAVGVGYHYLGKVRFLFLCGGGKEVEVWGRDELVCSCSEGGESDAG